MSKKNLKIKPLLPWLLAFGFAILFLGAVIFAQQKSYSPTTSPSTEPQQEKLPETVIEKKQKEKEVLVARVVDGDTVELEDGTRVRYIGIDTPEPGQCLGSEATQINIGLVEKEKVKLELDIQKQDKYGRTLAYIWVGGTLVNEKLVRDGFAKVTTYPPDIKYVDRFLEAQKEAKEQNLGLWAPNVCTSPQPSLAPEVQSAETGCLVKGNISSSGERIYHMPGQRYYEKTKIEESKGERWFCSEEEAVSSGWRKSKA